LLPLLPGQRAVHAPRHLPAWRKLVRLGAHGPHDGVRVQGRRARVSLGGRHREGSLNRPRGRTREDLRPRAGGMRLSRPLACALAFVLLAPLAGALPAQSGSVTPSGAGAFNGLQIALADFLGNGHLEAVVQSDNGNVYVVDPAAGTTLATFAAGNAGCTSACYSFEGVSGPINAPVVADVDKDGALDVIVANTAAVVARFSFNPSASSATSFAFTKVWERRMNDYQSFTTMDGSPALADLNGDGKLDIVVSTEEQGVFALRPDGSLLWGKNVPGGHASPSVRDID